MGLEDLANHPEEFGCRRVLLEKIATVPFLLQRQELLDFLLMAALEMSVTSARAVHSLSKARLSTDNFQKVMEDAAALMLALSPS